MTTIDALLERLRLTGFDEDDCFYVNWMVYHSHVKLEQCQLYEDSPNGNAELAKVLQYEMDELRRENIGLSHSYSYCAE
jgi:hypothetical protein